MEVLKNIILTLFTFKKLSNSPKIYKKRIFI